MQHDYRYGDLGSEASASKIDKYIDGIFQPIQKIDEQYKYYLSQNYSDKYWKDTTLHDYSYRNNDTTHIGVWLTCLVAWNMEKQKTYEFLNKWYLENLLFSTQDQISFPYVAQRMKVDPYTYPDKNNPSFHTSFVSCWYIKHDHGK